MATKRLSRGVTVTYPDTHTATRRRPGAIERGLPGSIAHETLLQALRDNAFEDLDEVRLTPRRTRSIDPPARPGSVDVALELAPDEGAVVLAEQDGCYSWHLPQDAPVVTGARTRSFGPRTATFRIPIATAAPAPATRRRRSRAAEQTRSRGLLGDLLSGVVRVTVLKFAAPFLAGKAMAFLERHVEPGLVRITDPDPQTWTRVERLTDIGLPADRPARVLLLVHGTFSSTMHAFGVLGCTDDGRAFLGRALAAYDAVIGFDHPTLSVDPLANATDLLQRCNGYAGPVTFDVVCHSRGGLTTRSFAEQVLPGSGWAGQVDKAVFVAATNGGTHLASPERWRDLVDVTTNLATVGAGFLAGLPGGAPVAAVVGGVIRGIGALVKYLATYLLEEQGVPGLAAMVPGGPFVTDLNGTQPGQAGPGTPWFVAQSDFHVTLFDDSHRPAEFPRELAVRLAEGAVDQLFKAPNDLVVDVASMTEIDTAAGQFVADVLDFGTNDLVYHGNYFAQPRFTEAMSQWLLGSVGRDVAMAEPPMELPATDEVPATAEPPESGPDPAPAPGADDEPVTAHLLAEMPAKPVVGKTTALRVALSRKEIEGALDESGVLEAATLLALPGRELTVQVVPKRNCRIDGSATDTFTLPPGGGTSELRFDVVAVAAGEVAVAVVVRDGVVPLAMLTVEASAVATSSRSRKGATARASAVATPVAEPSALADTIWLEIMPTARDGGTVFAYAVRAESLHLLERFESPVLADVEGYVTELFRDLRQLRGDHPTGAAFLTALQDKGAQLFDELFPEELRALLWRHRAQLDRLVLLADEPYLPWELVHLKPAKGRRQKAPLFLGQLGLVRMQFTGFPPAVLQARAGRVRTICPDYLDPAYALTETAVEAAYLADRLAAAAVPATEREVGSLLRSGDFDVLHFSGHGLADPADVAAAKIMLTGRKGRGGSVTPQYLTATAVAQNARLRRPDGSGPLVVLNACQTGRGGQQLATLGGFARAFLAAGAAAYVSTLWSVGDAPAKDFVEAFYDRLLAGETVTTAARAGREAARAAGDASWLAYVVYARPDAVLSTT